MVEKTKKSGEESPLERKVITYGCIALAGATIGFGLGIGYGKWLSELILVVVWGRQGIGFEKISYLSFP